MSKKIIIVGIDPGTTLGYAILNLNGDVIEKGSSKQLNLNSLIKKIIAYGHVLAVGCDKKNTPSFVKQFATKVGAKLIHPYNDLKIDEKKKLAEHREFYDDHQMDAIASAIFAFKDIKGLIKKVELYTERNRCTDFFEDAVLLTVKNDMSVANAVGSLKNPKTKKPTKPIKPTVVQKPNPLQTKLQRRFQSVSSEKEQLKQQLTKTQKENKRIESKINSKSFALSDNLQKMAKFKDDKIRHLNKDKINLQKKVKFLEKIILTQKSLLADANNSHILKRLGNLSISELNKKSKILKIQEKDILLVEDPNIYSQKSISELKNITHIIFKKKPTQKTQKELNFIFIDASRLKIKEDKYFAAVKNTELKKHLSSKDILNKVIKEHKESKQTP